MNQLKAGAILNYVILGLNALVGILYTPYMLRMLGQEEYGIYSLAASVISYLSILDFGFGNAIIRYTAKFRAKGKIDEQYSLFGLFTILYSIIGVVAFCLGLLLYFNVNSIFSDTMSAIEISRIKSIVLLMLFNLSFSFPLSIYGGIITAYERFIFLRIIQIARILLSTTAMIFLLSCGYKAVAMVVVSTIFNFAALLINVFFCRKRLKIKIKYTNLNFSLLKEISIYSFWIFLNVIMDKIYWNTGQFILGAKFGSTTVAIYSIAIFFVGIYISYSTAISGVFLPKITTIVTKYSSNFKEISDLFIQIGRIQAIVVNLILSGFIIFGYKFILFWAGNDYTSCYIYVLIFFIALYPAMIQNIGITILQARNQMKFRSILYVCLAATSFIFQILLSQKYDIIGCVIAVAAVLIVGQGFIMNIYYNNVQQINILKFWKEISKISLVPACLTIVGFYLFQNHIILLNLYDVIISIIIYVCIYIIGLWYGGLNKCEKLMISKPFTRFFKIK